MQVGIAERTRILPSDLRRRFSKRSLLFNCRSLIRWGGLSRQGRPIGFGRFAFEDRLACRRRVSHRVGGVVKAIWRSKWAKIVVSIDGHSSSLFPEFASGRRLLWWLECVQSAPDSIVKLIRLLTSFLSCDIDDFVLLFGGLAKIRCRE